MPLRWSLLLAAAFLAPSAGAHEVRPAYLELNELTPHHYDVLFKVPARGEQRLALYVRLPDECQQDDARARFVGGAYLERWRASCAATLAGREIAIGGLPATRTDVLVRIHPATGGTQTARLTPSRPALVVAAAASRWQVAATYFELGVEHILFGIDHLLFVLALLFLVRSGRRLVATVTAFTAAHSLTLAAATLGWVRVPQAPVEAAIALSIVFVAREIVRGDRAGLAARRPWLVAFAFGLLHGLGFAGALSEIGLPEHAIPTALGFFNLGVEAGQLLFIGAVFGGVGAARWLLARAIPELQLGGAMSWTWARRASVPAAYAIGILATYWWIERTQRFWAA